MIDTKARSSATACGRTAKPVASGWDDASHERATAIGRRPARHPTERPGPRGRVRARSCGDVRLRAPSGGHLTAVDRSPKMIEAATSRNSAYVKADKAEFLVANLEDLDLGERRFDKAFAVRVGLFHRNPEHARVLVERWLAPGGVRLLRCAVEAESAG